MLLDFPRIITFLRKEQGYSQKYVAGELGISQALLSHYEKGIRECGLAFLVRLADFYNVSCDYLLGRSPERSGAKLTVEEIPEPGEAGRENTVSGGGSIMPILNKKLLFNSLNILFDMLSRCGSKTLTTEVSHYLMIAVYEVFRTTYSANPKNHQGLFTIPHAMHFGISASGLATSIARINACIAGNVTTDDVQPISNTDSLLLSSDELSKKYPLFASSLLNLIQNVENKIY